MKIQDFCKSVGDGGCLAFCYLYCAGVVDPFEQLTIIKKAMDNKIIDEDCKQNRQSPYERNHPKKLIKIQPSRFSQGFSTFFIAYLCVGIPLLGFFEMEIKLVLLFALAGFVLAIAFASIFTLISMLNHNISNRDNKGE